MHEQQHNEVKLTDHSNHHEQASKPNLTDDHGAQRRRHDGTHQFGFDPRGKGWGSMRVLTSEVRKAWRGRGGINDDERQISIAADGERRQQVGGDHAKSGFEAKMGQLPPNQNGEHERTTEDKERSTRYPETHRWRWSTKKKVTTKSFYCRLALCSARNTTRSAPEGSVKHKEQISGDKTHPRRTLTPAASRRPNGGGYGLWQTRR